MSAILATIYGLGCAIMLCFSGLILAKDGWGAAPVIVYGLSVAALFGGAAALFAFVFP